MDEVIETVAVAAVAALVIAAGLAMWQAWNNVNACVYIDLARKHPHSHLPLPPFRYLPQKDGAYCPPASGRDVRIPSSFRRVESFPWGVRIWG